MHFKFRNVNDAFRGLIQALQYPHDVGRGCLPLRHTSSRNGPVLMIDEPVIITYSHPLERVLFNQARDANPFFHLFESLWMLAGRNDVASLDYFNSQMKQFSDDGETFNGAYGYRWRHSQWVNQANASPGDVPWEEVDQLKEIVAHLKAKPDSRRAVLQMWNVEDDLLKVNNSKDVCCNVCAFFSIRKNNKEGPFTFHEEDGAFTDDNLDYLDMTVINRSNDIILGMLGANAVHFSFLQEYMAACLGVDVGVYNQISNNAHVYTEKWEPDLWLIEAPVIYPACLHTPLVQNPTTFDQEVVQFVGREDRCLKNWSEPFLQTVAAPMCWAFKQHKDRNYEAALNTMTLVAADDWCIAGTNWIQKRKTNWEAKNATTCSE